VGPRHISSYLAGDDDEFLLDDDEEEGPHRVILLSANDEASLRANIKTLSDHLVNPRVKVSLADLAYTLSERRTRLFHRAYVTTRNTELNEQAFTLGKKNSETPRIGFIFTGQGAQWPQMGRDLLRAFPWTRSILEELDTVLQSLPDAPTWTLVEELTEPRTPEHLRQPEFSQPLVTALQLCILAVLESWGVKPQSVVGHSSGEMAAAYAAGLLSRADAITAAFYRGRAAVNRRHEAEADVGMLAVGLGPEALEPFLAKHKGSAWIACYNSPSSLTVSGKRPALEALQEEIKSAGHFARLLQVDLAYHSELMRVIGDEYEDLLGTKLNPAEGPSAGVSMFSSVTGALQTDAADALYWTTNMVSPVRFDEAARAMLSQENGPNFLIEIGPSGALAGPASQIRKALPGQGAQISYCAAWARGDGAAKALYDVAGRLFVAGGPVELAQVNEYNSGELPRTIIDLPNYVWNHSIKYWHENAASKDWRFKKYVNHDLLGSKVLGTSWKAPIWRKLLNLADVPWLNDHKMGPDVLMPGSGFIAMALEAIFQKKHALDGETGPASANDFCYRFRNVRFDKALVLEEGKDASIIVSLTSQPGSKDWHEFRISSINDDLVMEHCSGFVRLQDPVEETIVASKAGPLQSPTSGQMWYKAQSEIGYGFGPAFQKLQRVESISGQRHSRSIVSLTDPASKWSPQSYYPVHPAALDGCFQTVTPALWAGERDSLNAVVVPSMIDSLIINKVPARLEEGLSLADSQYSGRGRLEEAKSYFANCSVHDPATGALLVRLSGLRFAKLDQGLKADPHTFDRIAWKPDVTFLTSDQLDRLPADTAADKIQLVVDLIAHKKPTLNVLEINLDSTDASSLWFEGGDVPSRAAYAAYAFGSYDAKNLVSTQTKHDERRDAAFHLLDPTKEALGLPEEATAFDLVVIKSSDKLDLGAGEVLESLKPRLAERAYVLSVQTAPSDAAAWGTDSNSGSDGVSDSLAPPGEGESLLQSSTGSLAPGTPASSVSESGDAETNPDKQLNATLPSETTTTPNTRVLQLATDATLTAYLTILSTPSPTTTPPQRNLHIVRLTNTTPSTLPPALLAALQTSNWAVTEQHSAFNPALIPAATTAILVLDELFHPLLTRASPFQWSAVQALAAAGKQLLWVTRGSQLGDGAGVSNPDAALAQGLFRVVRMEDQSARLATLDVGGDAEGVEAGRAVEAVLRELVDAGPGKKVFVDYEFAEREGVVHVHRVVPDVEVNGFRKDEREGAVVVVGSLHGNKAAVSLRAERMGTFQGLVWGEKDADEVAVEEGRVEVEVCAAGVNFKDVAVTMGIVPENEYTLGYEAAGVVKRLGPGVTKFKEGDRVCFLANGSYANRLQVPAGRAHVIPDSMSFEVCFDLSRSSWRVN
jgi:acyl transferase domain-containing protein